MTKIPEHVKAERDRLARGFNATEYGSKIDWKKGFNAAWPIAAEYFEKENERLRDELVWAIKYFDSALPCGKECDGHAPHCGEPECQMRNSFRKALNPGEEE